MKTIVVSIKYELLRRIALQACESCPEYMAKSGMPIKVHTKECKQVQKLLEMTP